MTGVQGPSPSAVEDVRQGFEFIRRRVWLWGTLLSASIAYLAFMGPAEVLLPYVVKNELAQGIKAPSTPPRTASTRSCTIAPCR